MSGYKYREEVHFDSLTENGNGYPWIWHSVTVGAPATSGGGVVTKPVSPADSHPARALRVSPTAPPGTPWSSFGFVNDDSKARYNGHGSLGGVGISFEAFPQSKGSRAGELHQRLAVTQAQAACDQPTDPHNRHFLQRYLEVKDGPVDLLALLVDVNALKVINDAYGHSAGDVAPERGSHRAQAP